MLFLGKKIFSYFLDLAPWLIFFNLIGLFFLYRGKVKSARYLFLISTFLVIFFSLPFPHTKPIKLLETVYPYQRPKHDPKLSYISVLGHGHSVGDHIPLQSTLSNEALNRALGAFFLFKKNPQSQMILSGYSGANEKVSHARVLYSFLYELGVPPDKMTLLEDPKDTNEESQKIAAIVKDKKLAVVTSAIHMPRSMALFQSRGLNVEAVPAYFWIKKEKQKIGWKSFLPSSSRIRLFQIYMHEFFGLIWSKARGQI